RDGGGNIEQQRSVLQSTGPAAGPLITDNISRSVGRPMLRKRFAYTGGTPIASTYAYADTTPVSLDGEVSGLAPAPGLPSGLPRRPQDPSTQSRYRRAQHPRRVSEGLDPARLDSRSKRFTSDHLAHAVDRRIGAVRIRRRPSRDEREVDGAIRRVRTAHAPRA